MIGSHTTNESAGADSFDRFVDKNYPTVYRFAFCMSLTHEHAAQLSETAFTEAQRARRQDADAALDKRWLLASLHHDWTNRGRPSADTSVRTDYPSLAAALIQPRHVAQLDQAVVLGIIHGMNEKLRLALSLFYFEQLSYGEIAQILELSPDVVLARLAEAKTLLRRQLEEDRTESDPAARPPISPIKGSPGG